MHSLSAKKCFPCEGGIPPMGAKDAQKLLKLTNGWNLALNPPPAKIFKKFSFANFKEVMAFLNKVAVLAEEQNHHPDFRAGYKETTVSFTTHAINGLSENDFIMASKIDRLNSR